MKAYRVTYLIETNSGIESEETVTTTAPRFYKAWCKANAKLSVVKNGRRRLGILAIIDVGEAL